MSFGSLSLLQMALFVAGTTGVIVLLYWLKPPPQRFIVPSTVIWTRVLKERKRRSDFWRWLVSLLVAVTVGLLLASSVGKPEVEALSGRARRIAIVLDNSPTMRAETGSGASRWERAVDRARALVDEGSATSQYLITDTGGQLPGTGFMNRARAHELLGRLRPVFRDKVSFPSGDPLLSAGASGAETPTEVFFISDGVLTQEVPDHVTTLSVFEPADNVGITAFDLRPVPAEPTRNEGFLELSNHGNAPARVALQIDGAGGASVQRVVELGPGEVRGESLDVDNFVSGPIRVLIDASGDKFTLDNVAYSYLPAPRLVRTVLVTSGNRYLTKLLELDPRVSLETVAPEAYAEPTSTEDLPDIYIFDRFAPADAPAVPVLVLRPPAVSWLPTPTGQELTGLSLAGVSSEHPLLAYVSLEDVVVESALQVDPGEHRIVAGTPDQPLLLAGEAPARWAELTFGIADSNLALQPGFPILLANAVAWLAGTEVVAAPLGTISIPSAVAAVKDMRGNDVLTRTVAGHTAFTPDEPGLFTVRTEAGNRVFSANLLSPRVSAINASAFADRDAGAAGLAEVLTGSVGSGELWLVLILGALVIILVEWWTYHRRLTV